MTLEVNETLLKEYVNERLKENGTYQDLGDKFIEQQFDNNLHELNSYCEEFLAEIFAENIELCASNIV